MLGQASTLRADRHCEAMQALIADCSQLASPPGMPTGPPKKCRSFTAPPPCLLLPLLPPVPVA
jgi:hypothetical protein